MYLFRLIGKRLIIDFTQQSAENVLWTWIWIFVLVQLIYVNVYNSRIEIFNNEQQMEQIFILYQHFNFHIMIFNHPFKFPSISILMKIKYLRENYFFLRQFDFVFRKRNLLVPLAVL